MASNKESWSTIMQASVERKRSVRTPLLVAVVAGLHVVAVGAFLVMQGCGTKQPMVEPPPALRSPSSMVRTNTRAMAHWSMPQWS